MGDAGRTLEVKDVSRHFGGVKAVTAMSLHVDPGEFLSIIGPNGAGKTTLFNLIAGQDAPDAGQIRLAGQDTTGHSPERMAEHGLARTFQHGRVFPNLTVLENVLIGAHPRLHAARRGLPVLGSLIETLGALIRPNPPGHRQLVAEAEGIIARFGDRLTPRLHNPAHSLSYANRRRVEIARALMLRPLILLLDEPTAGMNQTETAEMLNLLRTLKDGGQTILLIEHKLELVFQLSDRVIAMDDGRKIAEDFPAAVRNDPAVIEAYLGHSTIGAASPLPSREGPGVGDARSLSVTGSPAP